MRNRGIKTNEVVIFLLSAILGSIYCFAPIIASGDLSFNGYEAQVIAQNILDGKGFSAPHNWDKGEHIATAIKAPLYSYVMALILGVFGSYALFVLLGLNILAISSANILSNRIAVTITRSEGIGFLVSLLCLASPFIWAFYRSIELSCIIIFISSLLAYLVIHTDFSKRSLAKIGLVAGVASLTISAMLVVLVGITFAISLLMARHEGRRLRQVLPRSSIVLIVGLFTIAPWTVRNYLVFGKPMLISSNLAYEIYRGANPLATGGMYDIHGKKLAVPVDWQRMDGLSEADAFPLFWPLVVDWAKAHPKRYLETRFYSFLYFWHPEVLSGHIEEFRTTKFRLLGICNLLFLGSAAAGFFLMWLQHRGALILFGLGFIVPLTGIYTMVHADLIWRYRAPVEPFLLIMSGIAISKLAVLVRGLIPKQGFRERRIASRSL